jgi:fumarate reductase flavoprotein subunit
MTTTDHDLICDLICIGGGYAGLAAAARATQLGLTAVVLERGTEELYACNSRVAGGVMHVSYNDPTTPPDALAKAITEITAGYADAALVNAMAGNASRAVHWLQSEGASFERLSTAGWRNWVLAPVRPPATHLEWRGIGADMALRTLEKNLRERGGALHRNTQVIDLIVENGVCVGVRAKQGERDAEFRGRAVLLADGGFQANLAMIKQHISPAPQSLKQRNVCTGVGDGVRMAQSAGAGVSKLEAFYGHVLSRDAMQNDRLWPYPQLDELAAAGLVVNQKGRRIADEGMGGVYITNAIAREADPLGTSVVFDDAIWQGPGRAAGIPPNATLVTHGGTLFKADSVAELAAKLQVDAAGLVATVRDYNAALASGNLSQLQPARSATRRKPMPLSTAPFYGAPACAGITYTMGGVRINAQAQVLRENGTVIAGLYAAGAVTGGLEGGPAVGYAGGLMKALTFGLLAAETVAAAKK